MRVTTVQTAVAADHAENRDRRKPTRMIPPFDDNGRLPTGIHRATLEEIDARFGRQSELRQIQMDSIRWMLDLARRADVQRIVLSGSFTTDIMEPNDVDCVLLFSPGVRSDRAAFRNLRKGLPFLDIALADSADFDEFVSDTFAADRDGTPKGMIEVVL